MRWLPSYSLTTYSSIGAALVTIASLAWGLAAYGEDAYEIMTGGVVGQSSPSLSRVLAYGENPTSPIPAKERGAIVVNRNDSDELLLRKNL
jgi:hypothetical protein